MRVTARHTTAHEQHMMQGCNCVKEQSQQAKMQEEKAQQCKKQ